MPRPSSDVQTEPYEGYRCRFRVELDDPRPVTFPPPGPYWVTGEDIDGHGKYIVAYVRIRKDVHAFWPEAEDVDATRVKEIVFTSRFERPDWWKEGV